MAVAQARGPPAPLSSVYPTGSDQVDCIVTYSSFVIGSDTDGISGAFRFFAWPTFMGLSAARAELQIAKFATAETVTCPRARFPRPLSFSHTQRILLLSKEIT